MGPRLLFNRESDSTPLFENNQQYKSNVKEPRGEAYSLNTGCIQVAYGFLTGTLGTPPGIPFVGKVTKWVDYASKSESLEQMYFVKLST